MTPPQSNSIAPDCVVLILPRSRLSSLDIFAAPQDPPNAQTTAQDQAVALGQQEVYLRLAVSQLVMLYGASIDGIATSESNCIPGLPNLKLTRKGGRGVKTACVNCRDVGKRCDSGRPCSRCKRMNLSGCRDAPSKSRKGASKCIIAGPPSDHPTPTPSTSSPVYELPRQTPSNVAPLAGHIGTEAVDTSTQLWDSSTGYRPNDASMSNACTRRFADDPSMDPMAYTYDNPAQSQGDLTRFLSISSPTAMSPSPVMECTSADHHTLDTQGSWVHYPHTLASGSTQDLPRFETYSISPSSAIDIQAPWNQGW